MSLFVAIPHRQTNFLCSSTGPTQKSAGQSSKTSSTRGPCDEISFNAALKTSPSDLRADDPPHGGEAVCPAFGGYSQEGGPTGAADAQMSSRYRWLVTRPVSHALPSAAEAPVRLQKRSTKACLTSGAMREASPHTNTSASFCKSSHTASPFAVIACCTYVFGLPGSREKAHTSFVTPPPRTRASRPRKGSPARDRGSQRRGATRRSARPVF